MALTDLELFAGLDPEDAVVLEATLERRPAEARILFAAPLPGTGGAEGGPSPPGGGPRGRGDLLIRVSSNCPYRGVKVPERFPATARGQDMAFRDHPAFAEDGYGGSGAGAVIIGLADRRVHSAPIVAEAEPLPVADVSLRRSRARLSKLEERGWTVIDAPGVHHLVISRAGVFAVTTVRLVGHVLVAGDVLLHNGHCTDYLGRIEADAATLSARLGWAAGAPVTVHPVLVVDAEALAVREKPALVSVISSHRLGRWLERQPQDGEAHDAFRLATLAGRPSTWSR